jgi:hypothetical protein
MNPSNQFPAENIVPGSHLESANDVEGTHEVIDLMTLHPDLVARAEQPVMPEDLLGLPHLMSKLVAA